VSDLSELIEQLADGPVLLATDRESADADWDNGERGLPYPGMRRPDAGRPSALAARGKAE
jgi:hypothetical protein